VSPGKKLEIQMDLNIGTLMISRYNILSVYSLLSIKVISMGTTVSKPIVPTKGKGKR
jgi:hypothetical protein